MFLSASELATETPIHPAQTFFSHKNEKNKNVKNLTFLSGQLIIFRISVVIIYLLSKQIVLLVAFVDLD